MVAIPFVYLRVPDFIGGMMGLPADGLGTIKLVTAFPLMVLFGWMAYRNQVGGMLALPIFFAALLEDMGFYALAPGFAMCVMFLMGERRIKWMTGRCGGRRRHPFVSVREVALRRIADGQHSSFLRFRHVGRNDPAIGQLGH